MLKTTDHSYFHEVSLNFSELHDQVEDLEKVNGASCCCSEDDPTKIYLNFPTFETLNEWLGEPELMQAMFDNHRDLDIVQGRDPSAIGLFIDGALYAVMKLERSNADEEVENV